MRLNRPAQEVGGSIDKACNSRSGTATDQQPSRLNYPLKREYLTHAGDDSSADHLITAA